MQLAGGKNQMFSTFQGQRRFCLFQQVGKGGGNGQKQKRGTNILKECIQLKHHTINAILCEELTASQIKPLPPIMLSFCSILKTGAASSSKVAVLPTY